MNTSEEIFILIAVLGIFFIGRWTTKQLKPKTQLITRFVSFIALLIFFFVSSAKNHFTSIQLIVLIAFAIVNSFYLFYSFKKLKQEQSSRVS